MSRIDSPPREIVSETITVEAPVGQTVATQVVVIEKSVGDLEKPIHIRESAVRWGMLLAGLVFPFAGMMASLLPGLITGSSGPSALRAETSTLQALALIGLALDVVGAFYLACQLLDGHGPVLPYVTTVIASGMPAGLLTVGAGWFVWGFPIAVPVAIETWLFAGLYCAIAHGGRVRRRTGTTIEAWMQDGARADAARPTRAGTAWRVVGTVLLTAASLSLLRFVQVGVLWLEHGSVSGAGPTILTFLPERLARFLTESLALGTFSVVAVMLAGVLIAALWARSTTHWARRLCSRHLVIVSREGGVVGKPYPLVGVIGVLCILLGFALQSLQVLAPLLSVRAG